MSDYSTVEDPKLHPAPLTSVRVDDGSPYTRFRDVEKEITHILQSAEPAKMLIASMANFKTQTLVYFARRSGKNSHLVAKLVHEIMLRAAKVVAQTCRGYTATDVDMILGGVRVHLVPLLLPATPTRMSDNLEVDFNNAVRQQTLKEQRPFKHAPRAGKFVSASTTGDRSDPLDMVMDENASNALDELIRKTNPQLLRQLLRAIKNPKHRKAFILRKLREWPMTDEDPSKPTVTKYFGLRPEQARNVQYWIDRAIKEMREAFGELQ